MWGFLLYATLHMPSSAQEAQHGSSAKQCTWHTRGLHRQTAAWPGLAGIAARTEGKACSKPCSLLGGLHLNHAASVQRAQHARRALPVLHEGCRVHISAATLPEPPNWPHHVASAGISWLHGLIQTELESENVQNSTGQSQGSLDMQSAHAHAFNADACEKSGMQSRDAANAAAGSQEAASRPERLSAAPIINAAIVGHQRTPAGQQGSHLF